MIRADKRQYHYIYKITRFDRKFYIGLHSTDNLKDGYFGSGVYLWKSVKRHGKEKHKFEIVEFCQTRQEVKDRERFLVNNECLLDPLCMNLTIGGGSGGEITEATAQKIARAKLGSRATEETKLKMSNVRRGVPKSMEHRVAISKAHQGKIGLKHTAEAKAKVSAALMGRKASQETVAKLSAWQRGKPKPTITCPHCAKTGGNSNMTRYHFDNCRVLISEH